MLHKICIFVEISKLTKQINIITSIPMKVMKQLILKTIPRHTKNNKVTRSGQHRFTEQKSCLVNFYDEMTG